MRGLGLSTNSVIGQIVNVNKKEYYKQITNIILHHLRKGLQHFFTAVLS